MAHCAAHNGGESQCDQHKLLSHLYAVCTIEIYCFRSHFYPSDRCFQSTSPFILFVGVGFAFTQRCCSSTNLWIASMECAKSIFSLLFRFLSHNHHMTTNERHDQYGRLKNFIAQCGELSINIY